MSKGVLEVIHSNVWGPAQTTTFDRHQYYVIFIDDFSRHTWNYPMRQKSEVFKHFETFKNEVEKAINRHVRCLQSDGGKEYFSDEFIEYISERREFDENFQANIHLSKTEYPNGRTDI